MSPMERAILCFVARAGIAVSDHIVNRVVREEHEELLSASPRTEAVLKPSAFLVPSGRACGSCSSPLSLMLAAR